MEQDSQPRISDHSISEKIVSDGHQSALADHIRATAGAEIRCRGIYLSAGANPKCCFVEAVWETQHDLSNMDNHMDAQHDNMPHVQGKHSNRVRSDQGSAGDVGSEPASCSKIVTKFQSDLIMPVFSNQDGDSP